MSEAERMHYTGTPIWVKFANAIAVFAGAFACMALLLRKRWTTSIFVVSLLAILGQMGYGLFFSNMLEVQGNGAAVLSVVIIVVAAFLVWYAHSAKKKGWLPI